jgi:hypothetical protein
VSRKTVAFSVPAPRPDLPARRDQDAPDAWVSRPEPVPPEHGVAEASGSRFILDLGANRTLFEVAALSMLVPVALGWFWFAHAVGARLRR